MNKRQIVIEIICFLFIVLFVYAALMKLIDVEKFRVQIGQSPILTPFAYWIAWLIPITEVIVAIMLIIQRFRLVGLYSAFMLMTMFSAYIIAILNFSDHIPCSCGGVLEKLGWGEHLAFNIAFVLLAVIAILIHSTKTSGENQAILHDEIIIKTKEFTGR